MTNTPELTEAMIEAGVDYAINGPGLGGGIKWPDHIRWAND